MATQLEMLMEQESGFYVPGDQPSFGSIYSDAGAAGQAASDWASIITKGLGTVVDLEILKRYGPGSQLESFGLPRQDTGAVAGTHNLSVQAMAPWLIGGGLVLVLLFVLRK